VQTDFKEITTVPPDPEGKQQHVIETLNFVDAGTSILLSAQAHPDFHAETASSCGGDLFTRLWPSSPSPYADL
jgi:hypothetical protein